MTGQYFQNPWSTVRFKSATFHVTVLTLLFQFGDGARPHDHFCGAAPGELSCSFAVSLSRRSYCSSPEVFFRLRLRSSVLW
jgi:hypothetical protein